MKTLLVQTAFLGDVILSTPLLTNIHTIDPKAELWVLTTPAAAPLIERDPLVKGVLVFDKRGAFRGMRGLFAFAMQLRDQRFERVYSLHRSFRTALLLFLANIPERIGFRDAVGSFLYTRRVKKANALHAVERSLSLLTPFLDHFDDSLRLYPPAEQDVSNQVASLSQSRPVVLVPGSAWKTKRWDAQGFRGVAEHYLAAGHSVAVVGAPDEQEIALEVCQGLEVVNLAGRTSLSEMMFLIQHASVVVCNDSMALHLASSFQTPTVAIFCATSPEFGFGPWKNRAVVVEKKGLYCKPCRRHGGNVCPTGTESCMRDVSCREVIEAVDGLLCESCPHPSLS